MARRSFTPEQIIHKLRAAEVLIAQGLPVQQAARQMDVSEQTYDRWRKESGGLQVDQAKRLKRLVAEKELDIQILKEPLTLEAKNY